MFHDFKWYRDPLLFCLALMLNLSERLCKLLISSVFVIAYACCGNVAVAVRL